MCSSRILIVDDDEACCDAMATLLSGRGHAVEVAHDGASALEMARRQPFGLLITDFRMPDMNGVELFKQVRRVQPEIEGILVSGEMSESRRAAALDTGMSAAFHKPFDSSELLALTATTFRRLRQESDLLVGRSYIAS